MEKMDRKILVVFSIFLVLTTFSVYTAMLRAQPRVSADQYRPRYLVVLYDLDTGEIMSYGATAGMVTICPGPYEKPQVNYALAYYLLPEDLRSHAIINRLYKSGGLRVDPATATLIIGDHNIRPFKYLSPQEALQRCSEVPPPYPKL